LLCAAYEAIALDKPLVMSDKAALRDYFRKGVVFTSNDSRSLAASLREAQRDIDRLRFEVRESKEELSKDWEKRFFRLRAAVDSLASDEPQRR
jgi:hypothetical protein